MCVFPEKKTAVEKTTVDVVVMDKPGIGQAETVVPPDNVEPKNDNDENAKPSSKLSKSARKRANKKNKQQTQTTVMASVADGGEQKTTTAVAGKPTMVQTETVFTVSKTYSSIMVNTPDIQIRQEKLIYKMTQESSVTALSLIPIATDLFEKLISKPRNLNATDLRAVWFLMSKLVMSRNDMFDDGFAFPTTVAGHAVCHRTSYKRLQQLNPVAKEFIMTNRCVEPQQQQIQDQPQELQQQQQQHQELNNNDTVACVRCSAFFSLNNPRPEPCRYHYGKVKNPMYLGLSSLDPNGPPLYSCCKKPRESPGCTGAEYHVWDGITAGTNGPLPDFWETYDKYKHNIVEINSYYTMPVFPDDDVDDETWILPQNPEHKYRVYGLDCEMCYTRSGLELTKITLVDVTNTIIYDTFVQPANKIVDYNTRFSGITAELLAEGPTKSLTMVKRDLLQYIDGDTILVGHGLSMDLLALRLFHFRVVDTSVIFPHCKGKSYKYSLRHLATNVLTRTIQNEEIGHDSKEDARTAMDIVLMKLYKDNEHHENKKFIQ